MAIAASRNTDWCEYAVLPQRRNMLCISCDHHPFCSATLIFGKQNQQKKLCRGSISVNGKPYPLGENKALLVRGRGLGLGAAGPRRGRNLGASPSHGSGPSPKSLRAGGRARGAGIGGSWANRTGELQPTALKARADLPPTPFSLLQAASVGDGCCSGLQGTLALGRPPVNLRLRRASVPEEIRRGIASRGPRQALARGLPAAMS